MSRYQPARVLPGDEPAQWGDPVSIEYDERDVSLYAVGIGSNDLRYVYEGHPRFSVFPTFAVRWGWIGLTVDPTAIPPAPGPLAIDAERSLESLAPLPRAGRVSVRTRLLAAHPRGKGSAFVECETEVSDDAGRLCVRLVNGVFRRGVERLGDIEPFEGRGRTRTTRVTAPDRQPDVQLDAAIPANQAHVYRLSGDYNPLHIDPEAARFGGFDAPILHGLCTYGHCGQLLLGALAGGDPSRFGTLKLRFSSPVFPGDTLRVRAWHDGPGRVVFDARVGERTVVSDAWFAWR